MLIWLPPGDKGLESASPPSHFFQVNIPLDTIHADIPAGNCPQTESAFFFPIEYFCLSGQHTTELSHKFSTPRSIERIRFLACL